MSNLSTFGITDWCALQREKVPRGAALGAAGEAGDGGATAGRSGAAKAATAGRSGAAKAAMAGKGTSKKKM